MTDSSEQPSNKKVPEAPALPDVDSPPPEDVLQDVPSTEEIIEQAESAEDIVKDQPGVDELLNRKPRG